jgi:hypothetical protein
MAQISVSNINNEYDSRWQCYTKNGGSSAVRKFWKVTDCLKNEPPGRNLGITLDMNKWALLERNSMQQNDIYNIPLPRDPGPKKKDNERQITRGGLKRRIPHGDTNYLLGKVV